MGESAIREREAADKTVAGEVSRVVDSAKELQESAASLISRISGEEHTLQQRALALDSTIQRLRSSISSLVKSRSLDSKDAEKMEEELCRANYIMTEGDAATFLPSKSHGWFMSMLLGPINVRAARKDIQLKVKEEYNSFRVSISCDGVPTAVDATITSTNVTSGLFNVFFGEQPCLPLPERFSVRRIIKNSQVNKN